MLTAAKTKIDYMGILIFLCAVFLPMRNQVAESIPYCDYIYFLLGAIICLVWVIAAIKHRALFSAIRKQFVYFLFCFLIVCIVIGKHIYMRMTGQSIYATAGFTVIFFAVFTFVMADIFARDRKRMTQFFSGFILSFVILYLIYADKFIIDVGFTIRAVGNFSNPNTLSTYAVCSFFLSLAMMVEHKKTKAAYLYVLTAAISLCAIVMSSSRSGVLAIGVGVVCIAICAALFHKSTRFTWRKMAGMGLAVILLAIGCVALIYPDVTTITDVRGEEYTNSAYDEIGMVPPEQKPDPDEPDPGQTPDSSMPTDPSEMHLGILDRLFNGNGTLSSGYKNNTRFRIWYEYLNHADQYWLFGAKLGQTTMPVGSKNYEPHNAFIYAFFHYGIIVLVVFIAVFISILKRFFICKNKKDTYVFLIATLAAVTVQGMLRNMLDAPCTWLAFMGVLQAYAATEKETCARESSPKRVLQAFSSLELGGAESRVMDLYRGLDKSKLQFDFLVTTPGRHYYTDEAESMGARVHTIVSWHKTGILHYGTQWVDLLTDNDYIAVHAQTTHDCGVALFFAWYCGIKIRIAHSRNTMSRQDSGWGKFYWYTMRALTRLMSNVKIACSREAGENLYGKRAMQKGKVIILHNAIQLSKFNEATADVKEAYRKELGIEAFSYVIGTVGNARPVKNHPFLVKAFHAFLQRQPNSVLLFVGRDEDDAEAKQLIASFGIEKNVRFLGERKDVPKMISCMDVFVLPSLNEGAPGVILEAQAVNLPCILSDTITRDVDLEAGLLKYLPLDAPTNLWAEEMEKSCNMQRPPYEETLQHFREHGYDVASSLRALMQIYQVES